MDWRSDKKIMRYAAVWAVFFCAMTAGLACFFYFAENIRSDQWTELITTHGQLRDALEKNSSYYLHKRVELFGLLWLFLTVCSIFFCAAFCMMMTWERRKEQRVMQRYTKTVIRQLEQFRKGNYSVILLSEEVDGMLCGTDYLLIWDLLQELGKLVPMWRERMAEEENRTKSLVADISHQLKTPLAALRMSNELAAEKTLTDAEREMFAQKEAWEIRKLETLLEELLLLSKLESGMIQLRPQYTGIGKTILNAVEQVYLKAHEKRMELLVEQKEDVIIYHDTKWMAEAIANILDNAIKYSQAGSRIEIRRNSLQNSTLIEIEDWGIGVGEDELHKIFQRFYRGREAEQYAAEGAGIGLYLSRNVIERQGGAVVAKRKVEGGMIFKIILCCIIFCL